MHKENFVDNTNGKLDKILAFAATHPEKKSLEHCFSTLERIKENYGPKDVEILLYADWAQMSLGFSVFNEKINRSFLSGGIIFHGSIDNKPVQNLSVTLTPSSGWQVHT